MSLDNQNPPCAQASDAATAAPMSAYARVGAKLVDQGYVAIPTVPGKKIPGDFVEGRMIAMTGWTTRFAESPPSDEEISRWEGVPNAGVCIVLGAQSRNMVAIDIDIDEAVEPVMRALPHTPVRKMGQKGVTLFFRGNGIQSRAMNRIREDGTIERAIDILAEAKQTVLPPTIHPDIKKPYRWVGEISLVEAQDSDIPELPGDYFEILEELLRPFGYQQVPRQCPRKATNSPKAATSADDSDHPFDVLKRQAMENLGAWVPHLGLAKLRFIPSTGGYRAVAHWRSSSSGRDFKKRGRSLSITPTSIKDHGAGKGYNAFGLVRNALGLADDNAAYVWLDDRLNPSPGFSQGKPDNRAVAQARAIWDAAVAVTGSPGETYLRDARRIVTAGPLPTSIRWDATRHALAFALTSDRGQLTAVHLVTITPGAENPETTIGCVAESVVRFEATNPIAAGVVVFAKSAVSALALWAATGLEACAVLHPSRFLLIRETAPRDHLVVVAREDDPRAAGQSFRQASRAVIDARDHGLSVESVFPRNARRQGGESFADLCSDNGLLPVREAILSVIASHRRNIPTPMTRDETTPETLRHVASFGAAVELDRGKFHQQEAA